MVSRILSRGRLEVTDRSGLATGAEQTASFWREESRVGIECLWDLLAVRAAQTPGSTFLLPTEKNLDPITYAQLADAAMVVTARLEAEGVEAGDCVVTILPNSTLSALLFVTIIASGRTLVPLNPAASAADVSLVLEQVKPAAVIADASLTKRLSSVADGIWFVPNHATVVQHILRDDRRGKPAGTQQIAEIVYTSGSSGQPKGVVLSHKALLSNSFALGKAYDVADHARFLALCPLFHNSGQIFTTLTPIWASGATTPVRSELALHKFWQLVSTYQPHWLLVMNAFVAMAVEKAEQAPAKIPIKGVLAGGSPLAGNIFERFETAFGVPVFHVYGLTETTSVATGQRPGKRRGDRSAGTPLDNCSIRIVDGQGAEAPGRGEIQIRGDNLFSGYLGKPTLTGQKLDDGWLKTGDIGILDQDGNLTIVDRVDNMIIVGGENIYPGEIEALAGSLTGISEMIVVAAPDPILGSRLVLVYSTPGGHEPPDVTAWRATLSQRLSTFKIPSEFISLRELELADFPRSPNNKILRSQVAQAVLAHHREVTTTKQSVAPN
jgi:acyl-CoA synthetase (AMP-forming)/AMP-acid ligase II